MHDVYKMAVSFLSWYQDAGNICMSEDGIKSPMCERIIVSGFEIFPPKNGLQL